MLFYLQNEDVSKRSYLDIVRLDLETVVAHSEICAGTFS